MTQSGSVPPTADRPVRVGVTGHLDLTDATARAVAAELRHHLSGLRGAAPRPGAPAHLVGVSCLARGADAVFAQVLVELGGALEVVLPSADYREAQVDPEYAPLFDDLLGRAATVRTMPAARAGQAAYVAANDAMLAAIDRLVAVWDGEPAVRDGGTASVVTRARAQGIPVTVIWPPGARRGRTAPPATPGRRRSHRR